MGERFILGILFLPVICGNSQVGQYCHQEDTFSELNSVTQIVRILRRLHKSEMWHVSKLDLFSERFIQ